MLSIVLAGLVFSPFANQSGVADFASIRGVVTTGWPSYKPVANAQVVVSPTSICALRGPMPTVDTPS